MTDQELDALMRRLLLDTIRLEEDEVTELSVPFIPSARHKSHISKMLTDPLTWERRKTQPVWKKIFQRAAILLIVCSVSLGSLAVLNPSVYAQLKRWAVEIYQEQVIYRYSGNFITGELPLYEITDLPEGYVETEKERIVLSNSVSITYQAPGDKKIFLNYVYMKQGAASAYVEDDEDKVREIAVVVNGYNGTLFLQEDWENKRSVITWVDSAANIQFDIIGCLNYDEFLHIANSVSLVKMTN